MSAGRVPVQVSSGPPAGWDEFVRSHPDASPYHLASAVQVGQRAFGFKCHFLSAQDEHGALRGVLPLVEQPGILGGRTLVSLPFFNYGGILAGDDASAVGLWQAAERLAIERRARQVEMRHVNPMAALAVPASTEKVSMLLDLPGTPAELSKRLGSKLRSQIKRADRETPQVTAGGAELIDDFYPVFCSVMRDLGTPVYPARFFRCVLESLGDAATIVIIRIGGVPVAGAVLVQWRDTMEIPWAATLGRVKGLSINMRLYWEVLQLSIARGCRRFDFGRSSLDSGTFRFKQQWGAQPLQLHWHVWREGGAPVAQKRNSGAALELATRIWRRLPLSLANALGPRVSPRLPW